MKLRLFYLLIMMGFQSRAQTPLEAFLAGSVKDAELTELNRQEEYFQNNSFNSPWLREIEIRARSNDTEIGLEDYRLRFGLINPKEIRANKTHQKILRDQFALDRENKVNDILLQRYLILIEHYSLTSSLLLIDSAIQFNNRLRSTIEELDPTKQKETWLSLEEEELKLSLRKEAILGKIDVIKFILVHRHQFNDNLEWNDYNFADIEEIERTLSLGMNSTSIIERAIDQDLITATSLYEIKEAESRSNIGYLQAEYDIERGSEVSDHLGFQFGFSLPIFNADKPDLQRDKLDLIEKEVEAEEDKKEVVENRKMDELQLRRSLNQLLLVRDKQQEFSNLNDPSLLDDFDFGYYRKSVEYNNYLNEKELELFSYLLEQYIVLLHNRGSLVARPSINYLSKELRTFEME